MPPYKVRFLKEFSDLYTREQKLSTMLDKYHGNTLDFTPTCDIELLEAQHAVMLTYLHILLLRAKQEDIDLFSVFEDDDSDGSQRFDEVQSD